MEITEELMQIIQAKANTIMSSDNQEFNAYEYSGGNFDDAYYMGGDEENVVEGDVEAAPSGFYLIQPECLGADAEGHDGEGVSDFVGGFAVAVFDFALDYLTQQDYKHE